MKSYFRCLIGCYVYSRFSLLLVGCLFASGYLNASPVIESIKLNMKTANALGFQIDKSYEGWALTLEMIGPENLNDDCKPIKAGSFLTDKSGQELFGNIVQINEPIEPSVVAYVSIESGSILTVFIDYICSAKGSSSRRYEASTR